MVPTNLVDAERKGAKLAQRLAEPDSPTTTGKDLILSDTTNNGKKKANGHKEEGMCSAFPGHASCSSHHSDQGSAGALSLQDDLISNSILCTIQWLHSFDVMGRVQVDFNAAVIGVLPILPAILACMHVK